MKDVLVGANRIIRILKDGTSNQAEAKNMKRRLRLKMKGWISSEEDVQG